MLLISSASAQDQASPQADQSEAKPAAAAVDAEKPAPPIVVTPETLAQAVHDDVRAAARKYHLTPLQITGVISKRSESNGEVRWFQFDVKVKDDKADEPVIFCIFVGLKDPVSKDDKRLEQVAIGKTVTVLGKSISMGNGQVTLYKCIILPSQSP